MAAQHIQNGMTGTEVSKIARIYRWTEQTREVIGVHKEEIKMKKFEVGKTYYTRSACDHNCIYRFTVISRTAKMVTVIDGLGEKLKRKVSEWQYGSQEAEELIHPYGHYSMAPCVGATDDYIKG